MRRSQVQIKNKDEEMRELIEEAKQYRILKANDIKFNLNRRRLIEVREDREKWCEMWRDLVRKADLERNLKKF